MLDLPRRRGAAPRTTTTNPHVQLDQNAPVAMQEALAQMMFALPEVHERPSAISVPGARAMWLDERCDHGLEHVFLIGREFGHLHPPNDGSLHLALPPQVANQAIECGWAEHHPVALRGSIPMNIVMVYGPRDEQELAAVWQLVCASHAFALGAPSTTPDPQ